MIDYIHKREITSQCGNEKRFCEEIAASHIPQVLRERTLSGASCCDKVFAAAWLDSVNVLLGTKDNKLLLVDSQKDRNFGIPLPCRDSGPRENDIPSCGIHSISFNFSKSLVATGADNPNDVAVFQVPSFEPVTLLKKHRDWMFGVSWLTDTILATGSRDATVKLWSVGSSGHFVNEEPIADRLRHKNKVRDIKFCAESERLTTLSQDGTCNIWDPYTMEVISSVQMHYKKELRCLAVEYPLLAVGSKDFVSFVDMRCGHITKNVVSLDDGWGVNALSIRGPVVTCGGGKGRLSFFELRAMNYITLYPGKTTDLANPKEQLYFNTGKGYWDAGSDGEQPWHAVYAHTYDATGTSLLTVGGPIKYGQKGCYAAVW